MKKLRWAMDGGFWEVDVSTPVTVDGVARPVGGDTVPLGLSRGARLSRAKQIDFFQRFMIMPFVPSFSHANGLSFQRVLSLPLHDTWFPALVGQFNVQKFVTFLTGDERKKNDETFGQSIWRHLSHPNLYAFNLGLECLLTPQDTVLLSSESHKNNNGDDDDNSKSLRNKAVFHHKFPNHNLIVEATSPALFVDDLGRYWDVPFTLAVDLASLPSDAGASCHFCIDHTAGSPKQCEGQQQQQPQPRPSLLPGLSAKWAFSLKKNFDIWRSDAPKTKMVQPYDIFLSNPHISASTTLGTVITASVGDNSVRAHEPFGFRAQGAKSAVLADFFASATLSAQHGNFQKLFLDLTRFNARIDIPSGSKFLRGAFDLHNSQLPTLEAFQSICPSACLSFQQQIAGPFSFRIDAGVSVDVKKKKKEKEGKEWYLKVNDPVFALEYALQVLGSAKAVAWYSPRQREFMLELRFFET